MKAILANVTMIDSLYDWQDQLQPMSRHLQWPPLLTEFTLTHWGRVTHIFVGKLTNIGSDNGLSPGRRQANIWTNAGISLIGPFRTNFSEILIRIQTFSFKKMHLKMSSAKWRPFCLGLNELTSIQIRAWISNYMRVKQWGVINHACHNLNSSIVKLALKIGHGWLILSHINTWCNYLFMS